MSYYFLNLVKNILHFTHNILHTAFYKKHFTIEYVTTTKILQFTSIR